MNLVNTPADIVSLNGGTTLYNCKFPRQRVLPKQFVWTHRMYFSQAYLLCFAQSLENYSLFFKVLFRKNCFPEQLCSRSYNTVLFFHWIFQNFISESHRKENFSKTAAGGVNRSFDNYMEKFEHTTPIKVRALKILQKKLLKTFFGLVKKSFDKHSLAEIPKEKQTKKFLPTSVFPSRSLWWVEAFFAFIYQKSPSQGPKQFKVLQCFSTKIFVPKLFVWMHRIQFWQACRKFPAQSPKHFIHFHSSFFGERYCSPNT